MLKGRQDHVRSHVIPRALEQTSGMRGGTTTWMMVAGCLTWKVPAGSSALLAAHGEWPDSSTAQTWYWGSAQGRLWGRCRTDVAACWQARLQDTEYDLYILRPEEGLVVGRLRKGLFPFHPFRYGMSVNQSLVSHLSGCWWACCWKEGTNQVSFGMLFGGKSPFLMGKSTINGHFQ